MEQRTDSGETGASMLKVEPPESVDGLDVGCERKRGVWGGPKVWGQVEQWSCCSLRCVSLWKNGGWGVESLCFGQIEFKMTLLNPGSVAELTPECPIRSELVK